MWLAYSVLAAVCFGFRGILYQWTSQKPIERNLMLLGVYLSGAVVSVSAAALLGQSYTPAVWTGAFMGFFSFISNAAIYKGFAVGKASLVAVFTALTPIVVASLSYIRWGESLSPMQAVAFAVILAGIVIIRYSSDLSWKNLQGVQWALLAMVTFGITDVASKQAMLWQADKLPTLVIMYGTGAVLFFLLWYGGRLMERRMVSRAKQEVAVTSLGGEIHPEAGAAAFREKQKAANWPVAKTIGWGGIVGLSNISGMVFIMQAFSLGITGLVSAVVTTNVLLILLYARIVLKERWSLHQIIGICCALAGVLGLRLLE
ncbi:DMT family transporter [Paenibacillus oceani]|uniref:EamA family transporter n=1 Tax=Paenibacillus oceani TaxID=2772510 RepID=A0A927CEZ5_9BACL|nr:DMT family transporter [Paenibacillus oceani]MBD2865418.1 EamA family transporter [Paenibacillus oceani]